MQRFEQLQRQMTRRIRNPGAEAPEGVPTPSLKVYEELFYNNIENFVAGAFPVLREITDDEDWHKTVRRFMMEHRSTSPLFLDISQEFMQYLAESPELLPFPFTKELMFYEWLELALDVSEEEESFQTSSEIKLTDSIRLSKLAAVQAFEFPVHKIGAHNIPSEPESTPTHLVVYRNGADEVKFIEVNQVTAMLLESCQQPIAVNQLMDDIAVALAMDSDQVAKFGMELLNQMVELGVLFKA